MTRSTGEVLSSLQKSPTTARCKWALKPVNFETSRRTVLPPFTSSLSGALHWQIIVPAIFILPDFPNKAELYPMMLLRLNATHTIQKIVRWAAGQEKLTHDNLNWSNSALKLHWKIESTCCTDWWGADETPNEVDVVNEPSNEGETTLIFSTSWVWSSVEGVWRSGTWWRGAKKIWYLI